MSATSSRAWLGVAAVLACLSLAALTLLIPAAPSYDPWAWIVWGREVLAGDLSTVTGPSWKPLPVLFTAPLSPFGDAAPELWLVVVRALTVGAVGAGAAVGYRLAGRLGALLAGGLLAVTPWLWGLPLLGNTEGVLIFCVLGAVERQLAGRPGQGFAFGVAAGLLRPEAWPFLAFYALWLVVRDPHRLWWAVPALALLPALWLLPELWGSGNLWRAADRAQEVGPDSPANAARPALAVLENIVAMTPATVRLGLLTALLMLMLRLVPRRSVGPALGLAALGLAWLSLVAVMTEFGFSGINRYLYVPLGIGHVLAGAGLAWALLALRAPGRRRTLRVGLAGALVVVAAVGVVRSAKGWPIMLDFVERHGVVTGELDDVIARAGGERRLELCGSLHSSFLLTPPVAWTFERHLDEVTATPRAPAVVMRARLTETTPIDPPLRALAQAPGREVLARTKHWEVEAACGDR